MTVQHGYCTNVHAGANLAETWANLERHALAVKARVSPDSPMGIGLWLSAASARRLLTENQLPEFRDWLRRVGLTPFTLNGFPFGDFHQKVVKHDVYLPTWWEPARSEYTLDLISILDGLLEPGLAGSISTLPIAWGTPRPADARLQEAGRALRGIAAHLTQLEQESGRRITLCLEPEPGCVLQRSTDVVPFFEEYLLGGADQEAVRRHICVCHDICHAAVMFEEQADVLRRYESAGIAVGKIQVSSAVGMVWMNKPAQARRAALQQLGTFVEERYLHQTVVRPAVSAEPRFFEDLPIALLAAESLGTSAEWRVHFHVPIYLERIGDLDAMQSAIRDCLRYAVSRNLTSHFEVETYAWGVLPEPLRQPSLASGIAEELRWFRRALAENPGDAFGRGP